MSETTEEFRARKAPYEKKIGYAMSDEAWEYINERWTPTSLTMIAEEPGGVEIVDVIEAYEQGRERGYRDGLTDGA